MQNLKNQLFGVFKQLCFVGLMGLFVISCIDEKDLSQSNGGAEEGNNPELSPDFSTKKVVQINLSYDVPADFRVAFELYTQNPVEVDAMKSYVKDRTLLAHVTGKTGDGGKLSLPIEVASFVEDIYVYSPTTGVPMLLHGTIVDDKVELSSATSAVEPAKMASTRANQNLNTSDGCCYDWKTFNFAYQKLGEWDANGKPVLSERVLFSEKFNDAVNRTIPAMGDNDNVWNSIGNQTEVELSQPANVRLYFVRHNSARKNALAYYTYTGSKPSRDDVNNSLVVAYPNLGNSSGLVSGDCVVLKYRDGNTLSEDFPAGAKIGFALILDAYENKEVTQPAHIVYSNNKFNAYSFKSTENHDSSIMGERPQMVTFKADGHFVIAFEDMPRGGTMLGSSNGSVYHPADYSDDVFVLYSNPISALPEVPDVTPDPGTEPEPALKISTAGYYAFEDNWPTAGDYDMNDVVLKYTRDLRCDDKLNVTGIDETYEFVNNGANYANAFGYEIKGVRNNQIREVAITSTPNYTCVGQGLDAELSDATIMLFNNGKGVSVNTVFEVKTRLIMPLSYMLTFAPHPTTGKIPYNPFIVVGGYSTGENFLAKDRTEIHLPKYTPTPKANTSLFGTDEDISDPSKDLYYIRKGNKYPFALDLTQYNSTGEFKIPAEKEAVDIMYPRFNTWVEKGCGKTDSDWYLHPIK